MIVMIDAMVKAVQHVCAAGFLRRQTAGKSLADVKSSPFGRNDPGIKTGIFRRYTGLLPLFRTMHCGKTAKSSGFGV